MGVESKVPNANNMRLLWLRRVPITLAVKTPV